MAAELIGIELDLRGEEKVFEDLQRLDNMLKGFSGAKGKKTIELDLGQSKQRLLELKGEINETTEAIEKQKRKIRELKKEQSSIKDKESQAFKDKAKEIDTANGKLEEQKDHLSQVKTEYKDVTQRVNELNHALRNFAQIPFKQLFNNISTGLKHAGQNLQILGNTLTRIGSPFRGLMTGAVYGAGYKLLNTATEGLSNAFERYDTLKKYPLMMQQLGYIDNLDEAEAHTQKLSDAVDGLPTALDEIVGSAQRYTLALGDMTKGEDLAIAANNAFLASMSTEQQQYQGMMQLADLAAGATLKTTEWNSLIKAMPAAIKAVGEELGYVDIGQFEQDLRKNNISSQKFLDTLIKIGVGKDSALGKMAELSKGTWEALARNTKTAFSRLGEGALEALDDVAKAYSGKDVIGLLLEEKGVIDQWSASLQNWIRSHPDEIISFFEQLKKIDVAGFAQGALNGMKTVAKAIEWMVSALDGKGMEKVGWFMAIASPLGRAVTTLGGALKGLSHPLALIFAAVAKGTIMTKGELDKAGKGGLIKGLLEMFAGSNGKAMKEAVETTETVAEVAPKVGKFSLGLSNFFKAWAEVATMIGGSAFVAWGSMKLFKNTAKTFGEMVDIIKDIDWDVGAKAIAGMAGFLGGMATLSGIAGHFASQSGTLLLGELVVGVFTTLATGFAALDMHFVKSSLKSFADSIKYLKAGLKELEDVKDIGADTGVADKIGKAIEAFNQVTTLFRGDFNVDTKQWENGLKHFDKDFADSLKGLKDALKSIADIANLQIDTSKLGNIEKQVSPALTSIGSMLEALPEGLGTKGTSDSTNNLKSIISNLKSAFADLNGDNGILAQIPKINEAVKAMTADPELNAFNDFKVITKQIGDALSEAYVNLSGGLRGNGETLTLMQNAVKAVEQAKTLIGQINSIAGMEVKSQGFTNISSALEGIKNAFDTDGIAEIKSAIDNCVQSIKDALAAFEELNQTIEIDVKFKLSRSFYSTRDSVIKEIKDAKSKIKAQQSGISLSIGVSVIFSVVSNFASALANITRQKQALERATTGSSTPITNPIGQSSGGYVRPQYRAFGGEIFKPRGTDTVPAMLTEGEYVQNQHATKFWGLDFMRKVNAMDVRGAMQAMLTRAGNSTNIGRQSIVNNTVNNNQRVTQHIQTNNPSFAKMRAGRFAGAL